MLNGLWLSFFLVAAVAGFSRWLIGDDPTVFGAMVESLFAMAKLSVEVMVLLFGTMTLWLGLLRIAEQAGLVDSLARVLGPLFARLMPEVPRGHPALGLITMNFAANGLGLDNAATPIGLKAMRSLQELNPDKLAASNAQILFLVLNASSLTLLPVSIFMYRVQQGAVDPTLVFLPILLATSASTLVGLLSVALMQRLRLWDPVVLAYLIPGALLLGGFMALLAGLSATALAALSSLLGNLTLFGVILAFLLVGTLRKVKVYEQFIEGAREGFDIAKSLLPYLVAMLCAIGVLRASGALEFGLDGIRWIVETFGPGQAVLRQCRTRDADRNHADPWRGQLSRAGGGDRPGQYGNHLLRAGGVLRCGRYPACAPRSRLRPAGGTGWRHRRNQRYLLVLRLRQQSGAAQSPPAQPVASPGQHGVIVPVHAMPAACAR
jgi:spore maturation protein SpmA